MSVMMKFPEIASDGEASVKDGKVTFTYLTSLSNPVTRTKDVLEPEEIVQRVAGRMKRFAESPPGTRESEKSRAERKWISAQPKEVLKEAWGLMDDEEKMEFSMMLDGNSHFSLSNPVWAMQHARHLAAMYGDDGKELCVREKEPNAMTASELKSHIEKVRTGRDYD